MIKIIVDSSADYQKAELESNEVELVPLQVIINNKSYHDGVDLFSDEFYQLLTSSNDFPKTSQPSPHDFLNVFEKAKENGDTVLCILLSSALSGTYQSALLAKNMAEYDEIYLVDSKSAAVGIRVLVETAKKMINEGKDIIEIVAYLDKLKSHIKILAAVDTLEYLSKGGRVSKTVATIGGVANIKPMITVDKEGKVDVIGKRPGVTRITSLLLKQLENYRINNDYPIYSLFTYGTQNCEKMEAKIEKLGLSLTKRIQIGPTIGTHVGPEAFGICFVEEFE